MTPGSAIGTESFACLTAVSACGICVESIAMSMHCTCACTSLAMSGDRSGAVRGM